MLTTTSETANDKIHVATYYDRSALETREPYIWKPGNSNSFGITGREALLRKELAAMGQAGFSSLQKRIANKISNDRMLSFLQFFRNFQDDIS